MAEEANRSPNEPQSDANGSEQRDNGELWKGSTTGLISYISQGNDESCAYSYDNVGNIVSSTRGSVTTTYAYDGLGQLTRVNDPAENATWVYNYDRGGNILSKVKYAYTTGALGAALQSIAYTYGDANWKDKLTAYNGVGISYDAIGNPLSDGTWTYAWQKGRQLASMSKSGTSASFVYNADGLRIQKTVNGAVTNYILHGKNIVHLSRGSDDMHFWYDAQNRPAIIEFNSTKYAYIHNLQGDVVGLRDAAGTEAVRYTYDAWGKMLSTTGSLASTLGYMNPFRYRGYVYDEETGLYYLRSRYYNPTWERFVNADIIISKNQYPYCNNSPIVMNDDDGNVPSYCTKMTDSGGSSNGIVKRFNSKTSRENYDELNGLTSKAGMGKARIPSDPTLEHIDSISVEKTEVTVSVVEEYVLRTLVQLGAGLLGDKATSAIRSFVSGAIKKTNTVSIVVGLIVSLCVDPDVKPAGTYTKYTITVEGTGKLITNQADGSSYTQRHRIVTSTSYMIGPIGSNPVRMYYLGQSNYGYIYDPTLN